MGQKIGAQKGEQRFVKRNVDLLTARLTAFLPAQGNQNGDRQMNAGDKIGQRHGRVGRRAVGLRVEVGKAAESLGQGPEPGAIGVRTRPAVAGDGADDQPGVDLQQNIRTEPEFFHGPGSHVLDQDVGLADQLHEQLTACRRLEV